MKKFLIGLGLSIASINIVWATQSRESALGLDIVTRAERGANESRRYASSYPPPKPYKPSEKAKKIATWFKKYHANELKLDREVKAENGHKLYRPLTYKNTKKAIAIHHTVTSPQSAKVATVPEYLRAVYRYHAFKKDRGDIGYNLLIDENGVIYEGRRGGAGVIGAHSKFNNNQIIGIGLIGNYENKRPSSKMIASLTKLTTALARYYHINPYAKVTVHTSSKEDPYIVDQKAFGVLGHRDSGHTACPGKNVYNIIPTIRAKVASDLKKPQAKTIAPEIKSTKTAHNDQSAQAIYGIITEVVPSIDVASLNQKAKDLLNTYTIHITHPLSPKTTIGKNTTAKIAIYHKKTKKAYNGTLPIKIALRPVNDRIILSSSQVTEPNKTINIRGKKKGASIVTLIVDNQIIYAFPVIVQ